MPTTFPFPAAARFQDLLASPWLRPLNDVGAIDDLLGLVRPTWSLTSIKALVVDAIRETPAARTLVLQPNHRWPGHRAGQHVVVEAEIRGRRLKRTFSLSSAPGSDGLVAITVKRREGGKVSAWWNEDAARGDVIVLSKPAGDFVLPSPLPRRLAMVTAGSGITPAIAMLRALRDGNTRAEVLFVHSARSREDAIFGAELRAMARRLPWLDLRLHYTASSGRLEETALAALANEAGDAPAFVCGPEGFTAAVREAWRGAGHAASLRFEHFGLPPRTDRGAGSVQAIEATRSGMRFPAPGNLSLLEAAEAAGLSPAHGCRVGICHACKCRKLSGVVEDLRDGRVSDEPGETIQLCVTRPLSAVTLDL